MNINIKEFSKEIKKPKNKKIVSRTVRWISQVVFLIFFPSAFTSAFSGIKYIFTQFGSNQPIALSAFVTVLIALCAYTIIFGRFFCGYACPFGTLGDFIREIYLFICKKRKKKAISINKKISKYLSFIKYIILLVIVLLCFLGVYGSISGWSPWDVFSMITSGNLRLSKYILGSVLLVLIMVGMVFADRFFCRFLCPMGAVFSLLPVLPFLTIRRDKEKCIKGCSACQKVCPADLELVYEGSWDQNGDCFQCGKCLDICPKKSCRSCIGKFRGNEIWFTVLRALILIGVMILANVWIISKELTWNSELLHSFTIVFHFLLSRLYRSFYFHLF